MSQFELKQVTGNNDKVSGYNTSYNYVYLLRKNHEEDYLTLTVEEVFDLA